MPVYKEKLKLKDKQKPLLEGKYMMQDFYLSCDKEEFYSAEELIELVAGGHENSVTLEALMSLVQEMERDLGILKTTIAREWKNNEREVIERNLKSISSGK